MLARTTLAPFVFLFTKHVISLPFAVRNSSAHRGDPAPPQRGLLASGYYADVIVFDSTITDHATYEKPTLLSTGVEYVLVNGKVAIDAGKPNGVLAGRALKRGQ